MNVVARIEITFTEDGKLSVNMQVSDKILALGMLEMAKQGLTAEPKKPAGKASPVLLARGNLPPQRNGGG